MVRADLSKAKSTAVLSIRSRVSRVKLDIGCYLRNVNLNKN
jgi:hypothetical protein